MTKHEVVRGEDAVWCACGEATKLYIAHPNEIGQMPAYINGEAWASTHVPTFDEAIERMEKHVTVATQIDGEGNKTEIPTTISITAARDGGPRTTGGGRSGRSIRPSTERSAMRTWQRVDGSG